MSEKLAIIKTFSVKKTFNLILLKLSYYTMRFFGFNMFRAMPVALSIEPTTACNLRCPECPSGLRQFSRKTGNLTIQLHQQIIDQLHPTLTYINYYFQGEPFINPNLLEFINYANQKGIYTSTSTNAHFLTPKKAKETVLSGLKKIIISMDGTTQETYEKYRIEGNLEKVKEGVRNLVKAKRELMTNTPRVVIQFLVVRPNEHQIEDAKKLSNELGTDEIVFKTAQVYDYKNGNSLIPTDENFSRYKKNKDGSYRLKNKLHNNCWRMWSSAVITQDGKLVPCCFDKDAKYQLGDLHIQKFREIWQSKSYKNFRKQVFTNRKSIDICTNCTEGTKVF